MPAAMLPVRALGHASLRLTPPVRCLPEVSDWHRAVTGSARILGCFAGFVSLTAGGAAIAPLVHFGGTSVVACVVLAGVELVAAWLALATGRWPRGLCTALVASYLLTIQCLVLVWGWSASAVDWSPGSWSTPIVLLALGDRLQRRPFEPLASLLLGIGLLELEGAARAGEPFGGAVLDVIAFATATASAGLFLDALGRLVERQQRSSAAAEHADLRTRKAREEQQALRRASRVLHDHVLLALHAVAEPLGGLRDEEVTVACRDALAACEFGLEPRRSVVQSLAQESVLTRLNVDWRGDIGGAPGPVTAAFRVAIREALTNVERHAKVSSCRVVLEESRGRYRACVRDDGVGFDPAAVPSERLGIRGTIRRAMEDVGGSSRVTSVPGTGTIVALEWPGSEPGGAWAPRALADQMACRWMTRSVWPQLAQTGLLCLMCVQGATQPLVSGAVTFACLTGGAALTLRAQRTGLSSWGAGAACLLAAVGWLTNLWTTPSWARDGYLLWMAGGATGLVQLVMVNRPLRTAGRVGVGLLVAVCAGLVVRFGMRALVPLHGCLVAALNVAVCAYATLSITRLVVRDLTRAEGLSRRVRSAGRALEIGSLREVWWSGRALEPSLELLEQLASGRSSRQDPQVRERAGRLAADLRDEMFLGPAATDLCEAVSDTRRLGWQVRVALAPDHLPGSRDEVCELVALLGRPGPGREATLGVGLDGRVTLLVIGSDHTQQERWRAYGLEVVVDPDFATLSKGRSP